MPTVRTLGPVPTFWLKYHCYLNDEHVISIRNHMTLALSCYLLLCSEKEAEKLVARIDDDGSLDISFEEWRDYLMFHPR